MIKIQTRSENDKGYYMEVHLEGDPVILVQQLSSVFDKIYEKEPRLFEAALVFSKYTEDHT